MCQNGVLGVSKVKKSKQKLADMIHDAVGLPGLFVAVNKEAIYGWGANVIVAPAQMVNAQMAVNNIVAELRENYELAE
jgi:hypothetical protein